MTKLLGNMTVVEYLRQEAKKGRKLTATQAYRELCALVIKEEDRLTAKFSNRVFPNTSL